MRRILFFLLLAGCNEVILHDLDEEQANKVWVTLKEHQFHPEKRKTGTNWTIAVQSGESAHALSVLEKLRLPRRSRPKRNDGGGSLIPSRGERLALRERELSERLEDTLAVLPGIVEVRVHLVFESREHEIPTPASASVLIVTLPEVSVDPNQIREIVSGGGALSREKVTVAVAALPPITLAEGGMG